MDNRAARLAKIFLGHSLNIRSGDHLLISVSDFTPLDLLREAYKQALNLGAFVQLDVLGSNYDNLRADYGGLMNILLKHANKKQLSEPLAILQAKIKWADKNLRIVTIHNKNFLTQADPEKLNIWKKNYYPVIRKLIRKPWVLTFYPSTGMAQDAGMSYHDFLDYYYKACLVDYADMNKRIASLEKILDNGKTVQIIARGTDLTLGIAGRLANGTDSGRYNIPDGECFIGPLENQSAGFITFEYPQVFLGNEIRGIKLAFKKGKVVSYSAEHGQKQLAHLLNDHPGNRIIGELGIGMNTMIKKYIKEILFDEKIAGTVHLALGSSYENKRGGGKNEGTIHWDLVKDLRYQGTKLLVDGKVIMAEGKVLL